MWGDRIDEDPTGLLNEGFRYRDLETGVFITKDPIGNQIMMPKEKWMVDGKEVSYQEYEAALNPGVPQAGNGPTKTAKDSGQEADAHVAGSEEGAIPGQKSHMHTAAAGFPNLYTYVNDNPWTFFDPEGLSGQLTVATIADGSKIGSVTTGAHSWLIYKSDNPNAPVVTLGTFGNLNGAQHVKGLNTNSELSNPTTQTRSMHIDDKQEAKLSQFVAGKQKEGTKAWGLFKPCSSFAAQGWNSATGEKVSPRNWFGLSTPQALGNSIKAANGGQDHATVSPGVGRGRSVSKPVPPPPPRH